MGERAQRNAATRKLVGAVVRQYPSTSNPNKFYTTFMMPDGTTSCDCPAWIYRRSSAVRVCKHTELIRQAEKL